MATEASRTRRRLQALAEVRGLDNGPQVDWRAPSMDDVRHFTAAEPWEPPPAPVYTVADILGGRTVYAGPSKDLPGRTATHLDPRCAGTTDPVTDWAQRGSTACFTCIPFDALGIVLPEPDRATSPSANAKKAKSDRARAKKEALTRPMDPADVEAFLRDQPSKLLPDSDHMLTPDIVRAAMHWAMEWGDPSNEFMAKMRLESADAEHKAGLITGPMARGVLNVWRAQLVRSATRPQQPPAARPVGTAGVDLSGVPEGQYDVDGQLVWVNHGAPGGRWGGFVFAKDTTAAGRRFGLQAPGGRYGGAYGDGLARVARDPDRYSCRVNGY